uniref:Uncharacterized protein n=1 Tax=Candidatus Kentrum sp. DK TaxID=2126562 RepID=A0A450T6Y3_9GAMM|nr:MAG: hypothetical protein BECKDK2373C_GA0170839_109811 [Candidatus Kentron sp. DK]
MTRRSSGLSNKRINCGSFLAQFILIRYPGQSTHKGRYRNESDDMVGCYDPSQIISWSDHQASLPQKEGESGLEGENGNEFANMPRPYDT